jgi:hypothetical protein
LLPLINISNGGLWKYDLSNKGLTILKDNWLTHEMMILPKHVVNLGPLMVAQLLRYCATNLKVAGSIPDGVIAIFH